MSKEMQLAEILSDLVSLQPGVCSPAAALALVSARPSSSSASTQPPQDTHAHADDEDLLRARELVRLHYEVREKCRSGDVASGLAEARGMVERAVGGW